MSNWRRDFLDLGLDSSIYRYAARIILLPDEFLVKELQFPGWASRFVQPPPGTDLPLDTYFSGAVPLTGPFPQNATYAVFSD